MVRPAWGDGAGPGEGRGVAHARVSPVGGGVGLGAGLADGRLSSPCRAVGQMMSTLFYPLVTFVLLLVCIAYWAMTALYPLPTQPGPPGALGGGAGQHFCLSPSVRLEKGTPSSQQTQPCPESSTTGCISAPLCSGPPA